VRRAGDGVKMGAGVTEDAFSRRGRAIKHLRHSAEERLKELVQHRTVQGVLVAEIVIKQGLIDARQLGDGIHTCTGQSFVGELGGGGSQNGLARKLRLASRAEAGGSQRVQAAGHN